MKVIWSQIRLYDILAIRKSPGLKFQNKIDSTLLCQAYDKFGKSLPSYLNGDFAFALYESEKKYIFCARDPLGVISLYYTKTESGYKFSSNIDELLEQSGVHKKPNLKSMHTMLHSHSVDYNETMYEGIFRLPPGCLMAIEDGKEHIERYWHPEKIRIDYSITEEEAAKKLKELFTQAVKNRISNLEETAFEVSGGLDSSSVVSLLSESNPSSTIDSYSMDFGGLKCDESEYVDSILNTYPLHHQKIPAGKLDYNQKYSLKHLYAMSPNWPITTTFAMLIPMFEKMKQDAKKIVISGQGGDHLFTGTPYVLYDLFRRMKLYPLYKELRTHRRPWNSIKNFIVRPLLGKRNIRLIKALLGKKDVPSLLEEENGIKDISQIVGVKNPAHKNDLDMITMAAHSTLMDGNFFHCAENYFGIEYRHPFFDLELVEFALSLPPEMKYKEGTIKWILRKAMKGILPDKINNRTDKAEFSELLIQQIDAIDLNELFDDPYIVKLGLMEQSVIDSYRKEYEDKTVKYISFFWTIINVEYWYRYNFVEKL